MLAVGFLSTLSATLKRTPPKKGEFVKFGCVDSTLHAIYLHSEKITVVGVAYMALSHALRSPVRRFLFPTLNGVGTLVDALARGIGRADVVIHVGQRLR